MSGRFIGQAFASTVDFLRCLSQGGRGETTPTSCSIGSTAIPLTWRPKEEPYFVQVRGTEARPRGNAEEDCQLHRLCLNWKPDPGALNYQWTNGDILHLTMFVLEAERAHEVWQLPEVQFKKQKRSKLVSVSRRRIFFFKIILTARDQVWRQGPVRPERNCWRLDEPLYPRAQQGPSQKLSCQKLLSEQNIFDCFKTFFFRSTIVGSERTWTG